MSPIQQQIDWTSSIKGKAEIVGIAYIRTEVL